MIRENGEENFGTKKENPSSELKYPDIVQPAQEELPEKQDTELEFLAVYDKLKKNREEQKKIREELLRTFEKNGGEKIKVEKTEQESLEQNNEHMKKTVTRIQDIYTNCAKKFLPENSSLQNDIIRFYSDPKRLYTELSNVYRGLSEEKIDQEIEAMENAYLDKNKFLRFVSTRDYTVTN